MFTSIISGEISCLETGNKLQNNVTLLTKKAHAFYTCALKNLYSLFN